MLVAVISDVHGNRTAFDAVRADLRALAPDLVLHGGDLTNGGSDPAGIIDEIRDLGWPGVRGNTDEALFDPDSLQRFAATSTAPASIWSAVADIVEYERTLLGPARIGWLRTLPLTLLHEEAALVHAGPDDCWRVASDAQFRALARPCVVYGHVHTPFVREAGGYWLANAGSVGMPRDGDRRASYLLLDAGRPSVRRVEYDVEREVREIHARGVPRAAWIASMLR